MLFDGNDRNIDVTAPIAAHLAGVGDCSAQKKLPPSFQDDFDNLWTAAFGQAASERKAGSEEMEAQLKAMAEETMRDILSGNTSLHTDPVMARALMREVLQEIHGFRNQITGNAAPSSTEQFKNKLATLAMTLKKHAEKRKGQLKAHQEEGQDNLRGVGAAMGLKSHHMADGNAWLGHLNDHEHGIGLSLH